MENIQIKIDHKSNLEAQVYEIIGNQAWWTGTFDKIDRTVNHLEKLVCTVEDTEFNEFSDKLWGEISHNSLKMMNDGYCRWETEIENQFAHNVLTAVDTNVESYLLYDRFVRLLTKEIKMLEGLQFDSLMFIGSGPFPITAIILHQLTGCKVDCLEVDQESADISRKVIRKLGLEQAIKIHVGNGGEFDLSRYDVVLAALLAKPKSDILKNVLRTGGAHCKVLCRTSEGLRRLLYEPTSEDAYEGFNILSTQKAGYDDTICTVLLSKKLTS